MYLQSPYCEVTRGVSTLPCKGHKSTARKTPAFNSLVPTTQKGEERHCKSTVFHPRKKQSSPKNEFKLEHSIKSRINQPLHQCNSKIILKENYSTKYGTAMSKKTTVEGNFGPWPMLMNNPDVTNIIL